MQMSWLLRSEKSYKQHKTRSTNHVSFEMPRSVIFRSCIFRPCNFRGPSFSGLAFSAPPSLCLKTGLCRSSLINPIARKIYVLQFQQSHLRNGTVHGHEPRHDPLTHVLDLTDHVNSVNITAFSKATRYSQSQPPDQWWVGNTDTEPISRYFQIQIPIPTSVLQIPKNTEYRQKIPKIPNCRISDLSWLIFTM